MGDDANMERMRFVVVGPGGTGKSAITLSFVRNQFLEEYDPTIEDSYAKEFEVDDVEMHLDITDTAGQEEFRGLWGDKHINAGDGFIVVFSVVDDSSLADLEQFVTQIHRVKDSKYVPMVICANKVDLVNDREVTKEEGEAVAKNANAIYMETSARSRFNIEESFHELVREVRKDRKRRADAKAAAAAASGSAPTSPKSNGSDHSAPASPATQKKKGLLGLFSKLKK